MMRSTSNKSRTVHFSDQFRLPRQSFLRWNWKDQKAWKCFKFDKRCSGRCTGSSVERWVEGVRQGERWSFSKSFPWFRPFDSQSPVSTVAFFCSAFACKMILKSSIPISVITTASVQPLWQKLIATLCPFLMPKVLLSDDILFLFVYIFCCTPSSYKWVPLIINPCDTTSYCKIRRCLTNAEYQFTLGGFFLMIV